MNRRHLAGALRVTFDDLGSSAGLHRDGADVMRDDIVQFTRDACALVLGGAPDVLLFLLFEPPRALFESGEIGAARADIVAQAPAREDESGRDEERRPAIRTPQQLR